MSEHNPPSVPSPQKHFGERVTLLSFAKKNVRLKVITAGGFSALGTAMIKLAKDDSSVNLLLITAVAFFILLYIAFSLSDLASEGVHTQRLTAEALEAQAEKEETLVDYVEAQLIAAAARQEVAVRSAEARANRLSSIGIILMVSSVLVPFGLVYLYMSLPPAAPTTPAGAPPQRDWHLLLAGVSFGLLFIAAARGILLAEGRQREVYAREVRETAYYGDLRRALGMAQRLDKEYRDTANKSTREIVQKIMELMLERGGREPSATLTGDVPPASEHEFLKVLADAIKK